MACHTEGHQPNTETDRRTQDQYCQEGWGPASWLLQAIDQAAGDPGGFQGWRVPSSRASAFVVSGFALLKDVFQVQRENGSKELWKVRGVVVLVDDGLAELGAWGNQRPGSLPGALWELPWSVYYVQSPSTLSTPACPDLLYLLLRRPPPPAHPLPTPIMLYLHLLAAKPTQSALGGGLGDSLFSSFCGQRLVQGTWTCRWMAQLSVKTSLSPTLKPSCLATLTNLTDPKKECEGWRSRAVLVTALQTSGGPSRMRREHTLRACSALGTVPELLHSQ